MIDHNAMIGSLLFYGICELIFLIMLAIRSAYALEINSRASHVIMKDNRYTVDDARNNGNKYPIIILTLASCTVLVYSEASRIVGLIDLLVNPQPLAPYVTKADLTNHMIGDVGWSLLIFVMWWSIGHFIKEDKYII